MNKHRIFNFLLGILLVITLGCEDITEREKFQRPDWLPGKVFSTVFAQEYLNKFTECLKLTGMDTILDVSGAWTVFAPTDGAIDRYLAENQYGSVSDIPPDELLILVKSHIVQNPWTLDQLQGIDVNGWREDDNSDWRSYAFKFQTIFKKQNEKYWIVRNKEKESIVLDSTIADDFKIVYADSRKYTPVFYDAFVETNGISSEDFRFYFDRAYEPGYIYYAGGKVLKGDIFAENGFVHIIDRVVDPLLNAKEILERERPGESYKYFLELLYWYYPSFEMDYNATYDQPEVINGGDIDTLWELNFNDLLPDITNDDLPFNIHSELIRYRSWNTTYDYTLVIHNGLIAPTDDGFRDFIDNILTAKSGFSHWRDYKSLPWDIVELIIPQNFKSSPIYPSSYDYYNFFLNDGRFRQNESDIIRKEFGSNCTFIGVSSYTPDKVFTTVTAPVFCRPKFSRFRLALEYSGMDDQLATYNGELCFFPISDGALSLDSSLIVNWIDVNTKSYNFREYDRSRKQMVSLGSSTIRNRIRNQVGLSLPNGSANKEFIPTMGGSYIIWDHSANTVRGNRRSTIGYNGTEYTTNNPVQLNEPMDNGETYSVNYWFNVESKNMYTILKRYTEFFNLLKKAGLFNQGSGNFTFLNRNESYTVFVPSDEALNNFQADTLSNSELIEFLKYHFLVGTMIFTDNKQASGNYSTANGEFLDIQTGPDIIEVLDKNGDPYVTVQEEEEVNNIMVTESSTVSSLVHEIDKVLIRQ